MIDGVEQMGSPNPGLLGRLCLVIGRTTIGNAYTIASDGMHIGRERNDVIFPEDGYVSGLHCRIHHDGSGVVLTDVGSSNGTFLRVRGERRLLSGDLLLLGQQLSRLTYKKRTATRGRRRPGGVGGGPAGFAGGEGGARAPPCN